MSYIIAQKSSQFLFVLAIVKEKHGIVWFCQWCRVGYQCQGERGIVSLTRAQNILTSRKGSCIVLLNSNNRFQKVLMILLRE